MISNIDKHDIKPSETIKLTIDMLKNDHDLVKELYKEKPLDLGLDISNLGLDVATEIELLTPFTEWLSVNTVSCTVDNPNPEHDIKTIWVNNPMNNLMIYLI